MLSVVAEAIDIIFGSPLTTLSVIGPNPALGVRFFGIGNELEATIGALLLLGTGAALSLSRPSAAPRPDRRGDGADDDRRRARVRAWAARRRRRRRDHLPAGGAVAVIVALRLEPKRAALVIAVRRCSPWRCSSGSICSPVGTPTCRASVLGADGVDDLADVVTRRVEAALRSFPNYAGSAFFIAALVAIVAMIAGYRRTLSGWPAIAPPAGLAGAIGATVIGTLANDSAALLLMVGTAFIAAFCGLAWAVGDPADHRSGR